MDRRTVWAILLMMVIAVAPALFLKKPAARSPGRADSLATPAPDTARAPTARPPILTPYTGWDGGGLTLTGQF